MFISCYLLFHNNPYQQHVYLTSANVVSASVYNGMSTFTSYFNLRDINEDLQERNALLELEVVNLRNQVNDLRLAYADSISLPVDDVHNYEYTLARVISNSVSSPNNYITINRGSKHGIKPEMGIVDQNGVVGTVDAVGPNASRVISLLNTNFRLSCKVKNTDAFGSMVWDGTSPYFARLEGMPRHGQYNRGDTIVTSGYSAVFPEGIIVGVIDGDKKEARDNFISLRIRLTTDFTQLSTVRAISSELKSELDSLADATNRKEVVAK